MAKEKSDPITIRIRPTETMAIIRFLKKSSIPLPQDATTNAILRLLVDEIVRNDNAL